MGLLEEKAQLLAECRRIVKERIERAQQELLSYTAQSNEETKSSAGDKYETTRAMIHLEKEKIATQLNESLKLIKVLDMIKSKSEDSGLGKLINTDQGIFFISASLGEVKVGENKYVAISPVAPLGKLLAAAKSGESVIFNQRKYDVLAIV